MTFGLSRMAPQKPSGSPASAKLASEAIDILRGPLGQQFGDPEFRAQAIKLDGFLNEEGSGEGVSSEALYAFGTRLFIRELQKGVGDRLPDGSTITEKRLVAARRVGSDVVLELDIRAQKPDGTPFDYRAPVTKNRTSADTDEVLRVPIDEIRDRVRGARYLATAVEHAGGLDALIRAFQQELQAGGV